MIESTNNGNTEKAKSPAGGSKGYPTRPDLVVGIKQGKVAMLRINSEPPSFEITWPGVSELPLRLTADQIVSAASVWKAAFITWNVALQDIGIKAWKLSLALLSAHATVQEDAAASTAGEVLDALDAWLQGASAYLDRASLADSPFKRDGWCYFRLLAFERKLFSYGRFQYQRYRLPRSEIHRILRSIGGASLPIRLKEWGGQSTYVERLWRVPSDFRQENTAGDIPEMETEGHDD
jgi:hypothetical protein